MAMCKRLQFLTLFCFALVSGTPGKTQSSCNNKIVLVGQSQAGKSTFIQLMHEFYNKGHIPDSLKVGKGNQATTKEVTLYPLQNVARLKWTPFFPEEDEKQPRRYVTVDSVWGELKGMVTGKARAEDEQAKPEAEDAQAMASSCDDSSGDSGSCAANAEAQPEDTEDYYAVMLDKFLGNMGYKANIQVDTGSFDVKGSGWQNGAGCTHLDLIDTPGYDDDKLGSDEDHAFKVLKALQDAGSINAFVFLIGNGMNYGQSFQNVFNQYWNTFRRYHDRFIIVHSKWDPTQENYMALTHDREKDFKKVLPAAEMVQHFFIWGGPQVWPKQAYFFPEHKKALAALNVNKILSAIQSNEARETAKMLYYPTEGMRTTAHAWTRQIEGMLEGAEKALEIVNDKDALFNAELGRLHGESQEKKGKVKNTQQWLDDHDNDIEYPCKTLTISTWPGVLVGRETFVHLGCAVPIRGWKVVLATAHTRLDKHFHHSTGSTPSANYVKGKLSSSWLRGQHATVRAMTHMRDWHAKEIPAKKTELDKYQLEAKNAQKAIEEFEKKHQQNTHEQVKLKGKIETLHELMGTLDQEYMNLNFFMKVRDAYMDRANRELAAYAKALGLSI